MEKEYTIDSERILGEEQMAIRVLQQVDTGAHSHQFFELAYVTGGQAQNVLNGTAQTVQEGDYFIMDYDSVHSYRQGHGFSLINCLFLPELIDSTLEGCRTFDQFMQVCLVRYHKQYFGHTAVNRIFHDDDGRILQLLREAQREYLEKRTGYTEVFRCKLMEILILTMRKVVSEDRASEKKNLQSTAVLEAMHYLEQNYRSKAVLSNFCQVHHYSLQYISGRFKRETGLTVSEYLQKLRLEKSCELLLGSNKTVQKIAQEVGYEDVKFFNQLFRRKLNMSPGEFRKMSL